MDEESGKSVGACGIEDAAKDTASQIHVSAIKGGRVLWIMKNHPAKTR